MAVDYRVPGANKRTQDDLITNSKTNHEEKPEEKPEVRKSLQIEQLTIIYNGCHFIRNDE